MVDIKIVRDSDGRSKGFAYVSFASEKALREALALDNGMLDGIMILTTPDHRKEHPN